ncbi:MAG TPA: tetratricopeptide repeat protein [Planctomycetota bacterium]
MKLTSLAVLTLVTTLSGGCATTVSIRSMQPGAVAVGPARELVLLGGEGRRSAREFVGQALVQQCRTMGYFKLSDQSAEGHSVHVAGHQASIQNGSLTLGPEQAGLWIDVLEWNAARDEEEVTHTSPTGKSVVERVPVMRGNALLAVTLFDPSGRAFLAETEYEGWASVRPDAPREEAIEQAARNAIATLLREITPVQITTRVRLDDEDEGQEAILDTASAGATAQAARDLEAYVQQNPHSASAAYNLAVLREALGDFHGALEMYDRALSLGSKDYYSRARAGCARRLAAAESLSGP